MKKEFKIYKKGDFNPNNETLTILSNDGDRFNLAEKISKYFYLGYQVILKDKTFEIKSTNRVPNEFYLLENNEVIKVGTQINCLSYINNIMSDLITSNIITESK